MGVTAFVKISTVLQIVRSAIGAQSVPSNTVIMALATSLTLIAMAPVGQRIFDRAAPLAAQAEKKNQDTSALIEQGVLAVSEPMRDFLAKNSRGEGANALPPLVAKNARPEAERDKVGAKDLSRARARLRGDGAGTEAFAIGFPSTCRSSSSIRDRQRAPRARHANAESHAGELPFKLLLFVAIDGWGSGAGPRSRLLQIARDAGSSSFFSPA